jgi:adenylyl-sulfate kinase
VARPFPAAPAVVWFTGLSAAGKSTTARLFQARLIALGSRPCLLDGDALRAGLNRDLGYDAAARAENVRRAAEVAKLMADAGLVVLVALTSPSRAERVAARAVIKPHRFCEVYVDTPLAVAEARDPKGLYRRARRGELTDMVGLDLRYEPPKRPEVHFRTASQCVDEALDAILAELDLQ